MDEGKPSNPPSEFCLRSASGWASADIDPPPAGGLSVAVYYRNKEEVSRGFLIALSAMGVGQVEQLPEPAKPPAGGAKP
jgi:hypothetical protein